MFGCKETAKLIDVYLDGELGAVARAQLEAHLSLCHTCRRLLAQRKEEREFILGGFPVPALAPGFSAKVMARIKNSPQKRTHRGFPKSLLAPLFAALALFVVFFSPLLKAKLPENREPFSLQENFLLEDKENNQRASSAPALQRAPKLPEAPFEATDFLPAYLPPGFVPEAPQSAPEDGASLQETLAIYSNPETGERITLKIAPLGSCGLLPGEKRCFAQGGENVISWAVQKEGVWFCLTLAGNLDKEELEKVANSIAR